MKEATGGLILGYEAFIDKVRKLIEESETGEATRLEKYAARPPLAEIFESMERDEGIHDTVYRCGYKLKDVGNHLGLHYSRVSRIASRVAKSKTLDGQVYI
jgi:DNA-directed RNA polymerase specialized sigma subunit